MDATECVALPDELWAHVLSACGYVEVCAVACTCRQLARLAKAPRVWRALCERYNVAVKDDHSTDWRTVFRAECVAAELLSPRRFQESLTRLPPRTLHMRLLQAEAHVRRFHILKFALDVCVCGAAGPHQLARAL